MDRDNAEHKFKNAQFAHGLAMELIKSLTRADSIHTIEQARRDEKTAWHKLDAARKVFIEASLESIGR